MSMMTTLSMCMSCEFSRAVFVYYGGAPIFFSEQGPKSGPDVLYTMVTTSDDGMLPLVEISSSICGSPLITPLVGAELW